MNCNVLKLFIFSIVFIFISNAYSAQLILNTKFGSSVSGNNAALFTLTRASGSGTISFTGLIIGYYSNFNNENSCAGTKYGETLGTGGTPITGITLPKEYGLDQRSAPEIAVDEGFVAANSVSNIRCIILTAVGSLGNTDSKAYQVTCSGDCDTNTCICDQDTPAPPTTRTLTFT